MVHFRVPTKALDEYSAEDFIDTALEYIRLWRQNTNAKYLLTDFAIPLIQAASTRTDCLQERMEPLIGSKAPLLRILSTDQPDVYENPESLVPKNLI